MKPGDRDYSKGNPEDLRKAEATASRFLEDNGKQIAETLRAKLRFLEALVNRMEKQKMTLDQRLDCFARIAEIAALVEEDANGFFKLASQPLVARILTGK